MFRARFPLAFLFLLLVAPSHAQAAPSRDPVFYVCAHPDDCLLFMGPNLYDDVTSGMRKVVLIYLTSGDAGKPFAADGASYPFMREQASLEATDWMADIEKETPPSRRESEVVELEGQKVERVRYARTVSYFLRLPDGNFEGQGFEGYGLQSMRKLQTKKLEALESIDKLGAYGDWAALVGALSAIVAGEAVGEGRISVHVQEVDARINPGDHADHGAGAEAMLEALSRVPTVPCVSLYRHIGYAISHMEPNLSVLDLQNKAAAFAVLSATERRFSGVHDWNRAHTVYLPRNYFALGEMPS
ncbi:MAG: hypothetical protein FJX23_04335, partial [Alphaproteobacteria bacterium]|nr:hypothetical protein [Alphaproteobacteria bacterium]